jgi:hypothetical protein
MSSLDDRVRAIRRAGPVEMVQDGIRFAVLTPFLNPIPDSDLEGFSDILNREWGGFFKVTPNILLRRLHSGEVFVAAYDEAGPAGILEAHGVGVKYLLLRNAKNPEVDERIDKSSPEELAYRAARAVKEQYSDSRGYYHAITEKGVWKPVYDPSLLMLIDITKHPEKSSRVATGMVEFAKHLLIYDRGKVPQLKDVEYVLTLTPEGKGIEHWHFMNHAIPTGEKLIWARPGHQKEIKGVMASNEDVHPMCYLNPLYKPLMGRRPEGDKPKVFNMALT